MGSGRGGEQPSSLGPFSGQSPGRTHPRVAARGESGQGPWPVWPGRRQGPWARPPLLAQAMSQGHSLAAPLHWRASLPSSRGLSGRGLSCWLCPSPPALRDSSPAEEPVSCKQIFWPFCSVSRFTEAALLPVGTAAQGVSAWQPFAAVACVFSSHLGAVGTGGHPDLEPCSRGLSLALTDGPAPVSGLNESSGPPWL